MNYNQHILMSLTHTPRTITKKFKVYGRILLPNYIYQGQIISANNLFQVGPSDMRNSEVTVRMKYAGTENL